MPEDYHEDLIKRVAITSSIYPDPNTHIETVTYGDGGDSMRMLYTLLTGDGTRATRPLKLLAQIIRHPGRLAKVLLAKQWSRRTIILLVMQTLDNAIALRPRKGPFGTFSLQTEQDPERPTRRSSRSPTKPPNGSPSAPAGSPELDSPRPCSTSPPPRTSSARRDRADPSQGVVDADQRVFGYRDPARLRRLGGARQRRRQPVLTIAALAEHAMSKLPPAQAPAVDAPAAAAA